MERYTQGRIKKKSFPKIAQLRNMGKCIWALHCLILMLMLCSVHWTASGMFLQSRQMGARWGGGGEWVGWQWFLPGNSSWNEATTGKNVSRKSSKMSFHLLTSICQTWINFLIAKVFHVNSRTLGNGRIISYKINQTWLLLMF